MTKGVLVDTGPLVALFSARDQFHVVCREALELIECPLLTCWPVLVETAYILRKYPSSQRDLFRSFETGFLKLLPIEASEFTGIADLLEQYRDLTPQLADVTLIFLARREKLNTIFTLDRRDFRVYRGDRGEPFVLIPSAEL